MRRFFIEDLTAGTTEAVLSGDELRHVMVLRLAEGDEVALFNGRGLDVQGKITSITKELARVSIISTTEPCGESTLKITLLAGLSKAHKPELIIQKATELGVNAILFYSAGRSVPDVSARKIDTKLLRWRRVALEAAKQCRRSIVPLVTFEQGLAKALRVADSAEVKIFFYEDGGRAVADILSVHKGSLPQSAAILIGPEGGFTEAERASALDAGFTEATLGPRILRTETAAIVSVALLQHLLGDF